MTNDLTKGSPAAVILLYSLPIIAGNVFQQIYNLVDTVVVGRFVNYQALAGVGITNGLTFLVMGLVLGITGGVGVKMAHFAGAGDMSGLRRSIGTSMIICVGLALLLTFAAVALVDPMLQAIGTGDDIYAYAREYVVYIYAGIAAQIAYNLVACLLRAIGDSRTPLYFLIFSSLLNVGLDILFIAVFGMGVIGAAVATVISQGVSAVLCFAYAFRKYPYLRLCRSDFNTDWSFVWDHLRIGIPMALQFAITGVGIIFLQAALNNFPASCIAGFSAANKIQNISALAGISFSVAIANFSGQCYGAGDMLRVRRGVRATLGMSMVVCLVCSAIMAIFPDQLTSLFVSGRNEELFFAARTYLFTSAAFLPFLYILVIFRNALQGVGHAFGPMMGGVLELLIRAVTSFYLPSIWGMWGISMVDVLAWFGACVFVAILYYICIVRPWPFTMASTIN